MAVLIPKVGRIAALAAIVAEALEGCDLILWGNDLTPDADTVLGDLSEPGWAGYAPYGLSGWSAPALDGSSKAVTTAPTGSWTKTDAGSSGVYGWALVATGGELLMIQRFTSPPLTIDQFIPFALSVVYRFTQG